MPRKLMDYWLTVEGEPLSVSLSANPAGQRCVKVVKRRLVELELFRHVAENTLCDIHGHHQLIQENVQNP